MVATSRVKTYHLREQVFHLLIFELSAAPNGLEGLLVPAESVQDVGVLKEQVLLPSGTALANQLKSLLEVLGPH